MPGLWVLILISSPYWAAYHHHVLVFPTREVCMAAKAGANSQQYYPDCIPASALDDYITDAVENEVTADRGGYPG